MITPAFQVNVCVGPHSHLAGNSYLFLPYSISLMFQCIQYSPLPGTHLSWNPQAISSWPHLVWLLLVLYKIETKILIWQYFIWKKEISILTRTSANFRHSGVLVYLLTLARLFKVLLMTLKTYYSGLFGHLR